MSGNFTKLDDFLPYRLSTASNAVSGVISAEYKSRFGLKIPEWRVMAVLGNRISATQRDLVLATLMDKVTVNRATKALAERLLIERLPNSADGRSHHLQLTANGVELFNQIMPAAQAMERKIMAVLSDDEKSQLHAILKRIRDSAEAIGQPVK
jgi:DNA-binding MarR family transcriptional regulator